MEYLRTPDDRFERLLDYPFVPHYVDVGGLRMHYVDEGPADAPPVLMLHGEPTWSYLYRHMIPVCAAAGHRVIAPDLIGFGKSDKPTRIDDYSYQSHMDWMLSLLDQLALTRITLVCQDWGSLLGLRLAAENPDRFRAIVVGNGMLPTGDQTVPAAFQLWKNFAIYSPVFPVSRIIDAASFRKLGPDEKRAYEAPFPNRKYKAGARAFPKLVPVTPNDPATRANRTAWESLKQWRKPFLTTFSNGDPITRGGDKYMQEQVPGAKGQPHQTLTGGHFLQEDSPVAFAQAVNQLIATLPSQG
ncbi:MAG: haloalkane dehalogenase [Alcanivoracaceae bacterium]|nr:haloalkane dehalogenase [Alcanivoracaceae bacterium]MCG8439388.1 haloalkane dehalogenase [Pseudomonadales bacterium]MED5432435.1 haloalkane dehalogenase [Pseudomonadota bacterium]MEE2870809.1 haloalkane dehalogenase [Pseudomonadota bacterium]|tara:strand:+ start:1950 stop:2849 length:900 start_codon:yes stop_codon:yes gene_type:complete